MAKLRCLFAALLCLVPALASAQLGPSPGNITTPQATDFVPLYGRATGGPVFATVGALLAPILTQPNTWSALQTFNAGLATNGSLIITPPPSSAGFQIFQNVAGSSGVPIGNALNLIDITADIAAVGGGFLNGFQVTDNFGGSTVTGGRQGIAAFLNLSASTASTNTNRNYVALWGNAFTASGDGGTNTGAGAKGALFGAGSWCDLQSGATNLLGCTAEEFNVSVRAGASVKYKTVIQVVQHQLDAVAGTSLDAAIAISSQAPATGLAYGIAFGDFASAQPVNSTGTLIGITNPNSSTTAVATGLDFSAGTFSSYAVHTPGFLVDGSGNVVANALTTGNNVQAGAGGVLYWLGRAQMTSPVDGQIKLWNAANTGFTSLHFGGDTSSFPALKRNAAALESRLADDSAYATFNAANFGAGIIYSAAGTALPSCAAGTNGISAVVSDATSATFAGAYSSGGAQTRRVLCISGTGWVTQ